MKRYVDSDYTIKALSIFSDKKNGNQDFLNGIETAKEVINNQSTTDVRENVRGEWVKVDEQPYFRKHFHKVCCSVCRKQGYDYWNFCPNCGADMRGDNNV